MLWSIIGFWTGQGCSYNVLWTREMMDLAVEIGKERQLSANKSQSKLEYLVSGVDNFLD